MYRTNPLDARSGKKVHLSYQFECREVEEYEMQLKTARTEEREIEDVGYWRLHLRYRSTTTL
jgi:hypothetical protein